jgi:hypothetical protein
MLARWGSNKPALTETVALSLHHLHFTVCSCLALDRILEAHDVTVASCAPLVAPLGFARFS